MSTTCCHLPSSFLLSWPFLICLQGTILLFSYSVALSLSPSLTLSPVFSLAAILPPHSFLSQLKLAQHHCRCVSSFVSLKVACIQLSLLFLFRHLLPLIYLFWVLSLFPLPFSSVLLFPAISCDLSDQQAMSFDPSQDGTVSFSYSFQPCPTDFFFLFFFFFLLLPCTPPSETTPPDMLFSPLPGIFFLCYTR